MLQEIDDVDPLNSPVELDEEVLDATLLDIYGLDAKLVERHI